MKKANVARISTISVVTLRPPAVEALPPPTIMRKIIRSAVLSWVAPISTVLKPAVRVVTDWNQLAASFAAHPSSPPSVSGLVHSSAAKNKVPESASTTVPVSISFECSARSRQARTCSASRITTKPSPPMIRSAGTAMLITGSATHLDRLSDQSAKPALLKADME